MQQLNPHHEVVIEEVGGVRTIRADATHIGREVDHDVGLSVCEQLQHRFALDQVVVSLPWNDDLFRTARLELFDHKRSQETRTAGHTETARTPEFLTFTGCVHLEQLLGRAGLPRFSRQS